MNDLIIKICGMREQADLDCAAALGVDLCGFIFAPQSPRAVTPEQAAALDSGACKPTDYFVCAGKISVAGTRFRCANGHVHGAETFAQGLAVSCNPCFIQIGARLGKERFCDYFAAFGLREATGIDLPGEIKRSEYYTADRMGPVNDFV